MRCSLTCFAIWSVLWRYYDANYTVIYIEPHGHVFPTDLHSTIFSFVGPLDLVRTNAREQFSKFFNEDEDLWRLLRMFRDIPELFSPNGPWKWLRNVTFHQHEEEEAINEFSSFHNTDNKFRFPLYCDWIGIVCKQRDPFYDGSLRFTVSLSIQNPHEIHWSEIPKPMTRIEIIHAHSVDKNESNMTDRPVIDFSDIDTESLLSRIKIQIERGDFLFNEHRVMKNIWNVHLNTSDGMVRDYTQLWRSLCFAHFLGIFPSKPMELSDFEHFRSLKAIELFKGKWNGTDNTGELRKYLNPFKYHPTRAIKTLYSVQCDDDEVLIWSTGWIVLWSAIQLILILTLLVLCLYMIYQIDHRRL